MVTGSRFRGRLLEVAVDYACASVDYGYLGNRLTMLTYLMLLAHRIQFADRAVHPHREVEKTYGHAVDTILGRGPIGTPVPTPGYHEPGAVDAECVRTLGVPAGRARTVVRTVLEAVVARILAVEAGSTATGAAYREEVYGAVREYIEVLTGMSRVANVPEDTR